MYQTALLLLLIIVCQWSAWRFKIPGLVLLTLGGLLLGPVLGYLHPKELFGAYWPILISLSVAIILFDGSLSLNFTELKTTKRAVHQLIWLGAPIAAVLNFAAAHYIAGLSVPTAAMFGCILIVTGPTVVIPLLRQAKLNARITTLLKWEGIFNDPLGVILAVLAFQYLVKMRAAQHITDYAISAGSLVLIIGASFLAAKLLDWLFSKGHMPQFLHVPAIFVAIINLYVLAENIHHEGGLLAVTVMGVTLANSHMPSLLDIRKFKEDISVLLVSIIFIFITATLSWEQLQLLNWRDAAFVFAVIFIIRPITVLLSTLGAGLSWKERILLGWIAPRGVVCAVISGFFGSELVSNGIADGERLVPLAFTVVFSTVLLHGFSLRPLGQRLQMVAPSAGGLLIIGSDDWLVDFAKLAFDKGVHLKLFSANWRHLRGARQANLPTQRENLLLEDMHALDLHEYSHVLAATDDFNYNALLCAKLGHAFDRTHIFQLSNEREDEDPHAALPHIVGQNFLSGLSADAIIERYQQGWRFKEVKLTPEFGFANYQEQHETVMPAISIDATGNFTLIKDAESLAKMTDTILISFVKVKETPQPIN